MSFQQDGTQETPSQPTLCTTGCGFFANVGSNGMCSKCYREHQSEEQKAQKAGEAIMSAAEAAKPAAAVFEPAPSSSAAAEAAESSPSVPAPVAQSTPESSGKPSTRCQVCRKKVGLTGFKCRCSDHAVFCGTHRYAEAHDCCFDYKGMQREKIAAANPLVQASKIEKI